MYEILRNEKLAEDTHLMEIGAPMVAERIKPGNFVILRISEKGERIPMSVFDFDRNKGVLTIVFKVVGKTTKDLSSLKEGDSIMNFVGPLGNPTEIEKFGTVVCIGGGIGIPPIYPIAREMRKAGNKVISIIGARRKYLLILEDEIKSVSDELHVTTDDGSYGHKGFVSDVLNMIIREGRKIDRVIAVGPLVMMKAVCDVTKPHGIKTIVSLNPIMVDGTGMCGCCRVTVGGETKFVCVDGPEFDGHEVDFDNLILRNNRFLEEEEKAKGGCYGSEKEKA
ncbi:MAG: sulfide/dihydroorotate dehydrogenase-like FAD/NAD-binding protein [Candidatus Aenigmarchaeota archaeon]|nr:sulfide/dihydroorotate dehydrogenase-like FAD/NAD-binding protein [Candidatus Aenigmarchaeota archaeon]